MKTALLIFLFLLPTAFTHNISDQTVKPPYMQFGHQNQFLQCYEFPNQGGLSIRYSTTISYKTYNNNRSPYFLIHRGVGLKTLAFSVWFFIFINLQKIRKNQFFRMTDYTADLRQYNFNKMASSCCFNGIWLLYEDFNYNINNLTVWCQINL